MKAAPRVWRGLHFMKHSLPSPLRSFWACLVSYPLAIFQRSYSELQSIANSFKTVSQYRQKREVRNQTMSGGKKKPDKATHQDWRVSNKATSNT